MQRSFGLASSLAWSLLATLSSCAAPPSKPTPKLQFDGERAQADVVRQVRFGPRVPGTESHDACVDFLESELKRYADKVEVQDCTRTVRGRPLPFRNLVARFAPERRPRVLLCAHWDTRPTAEHDPDPTRRGDPIPGANDGASGVAVLLELARALKASPLKLGVDLVLFDGEDTGSFQLGMAEVLLGAQDFAQRADAKDYRYAVLLDMVGRKGVKIMREAHSMACCAPLMNEIWAIAGDLGHGRHFASEPGSQIIDDHIPLQRAGFKAVDLIDLADPYWHTTADSPDKTDAESLKAVGEVMLELLRREAARP